MKKLTAFVSAVLLICMSENSNAENPSKLSAFALMEKLGISKIEGDFCEKTKMHLTKREVDEKVDELKKSLMLSHGVAMKDPIEKDNIDRILTDYKKTMTSGQDNSGRFVLFFGKKSSLLNYKATIDSKVISIWELQTSLGCFTYNELNKTIVVSPGGFTLASKTGFILYILSGCLENSDNANKKATQVAAESDRAFNCKELKKIKGISVPVRMSFNLLDPAFTKEVSVNFDEIAEGSADNAELKLPLFSNVTVQDERFTPPITYSALETLPPEKQVSDFVNDPGSLQKYNQSIRFRSN